MEENKNSQFSFETEDTYNQKTENAIKIPEGFKEKIMENVKNEKAKKNIIIKWVAIAACLVIVVGAIIFVPKLISDKSAEAGVEDAGDVAPGDSASDDNVLADSADNVDKESAADTENHLEAEKCEPILVGFEKVSTDVESKLGVELGAKAIFILNKHKFVLHEGHEMNWYEFYNGCIEGTVGNDKKAISDYAEYALEQFEAAEMTAEAAQAQAVIDALAGSEN